LQGCRPRGKFRTEGKCEGMNPHTLKGASTLGIGVLAMGISGVGSLETKCYLDVGLVEKHKVYYKWEGGGFPQVQAVMSLVNPNLPVAHPNTKNVPIMHSLTCCLVLCKFG